MLITQLKAKETIASLTAGKKVFIINCHGCKEVRFPEKEWERIYRRLEEIGRLDLLKCPTQVHNFATDDEVK